MLLAAVVGLGGVAGGRLALAEARAAIIMVVRKRLWYLTIDEAGLQQFAADLAATDSFAGYKLKALHTVGPLYRRLGFDGRGMVDMTVRHGEERIVSAFLLATDFFHNGADETKVVRYVRLYDPLKNLDACSAPFSRPVITT
jgi:hypothetical protein